MFAIFDRKTGDLSKDQHGHMKVYSTKTAAHRKAEDDNRAVYPKMNRYFAIEVRVSY